MTFGGAILNRCRGDFRGSDDDGSYRADVTGSRREVLQLLQVQDGGAVPLFELFELGDLQRREETCETEKKQTDDTSFNWIGGVSERARSEG